MDEKEFQKISKKTQETLGKVIKKPPLTDKLLKKPPFRFLHDIMTSVVRGTGFMKGLYTAAEMNSENVKEKDAKIAFLQKAVDMVALVTGKPVTVKPLKIVSGHEPEKTNEFLQLLAAAVHKKVDNDEYVKKVLSGDKSSKSSSSKKDKKEEPKEEKEKEKKKDREGSSRSREEREKKDKSRDRGEKKDEQSPARDERKDRHKSRDESSGKNRRERSRDGRDKENQRERSKDRTKDSDDKDEKRRHRREKESSSDKKEPKVNGDAIIQPEPTNDEGAAMAGVDEQPAKIPRPTSAKGSRRRTREGRTLRDSSGDEDEDEKFRSENQAPPRDDSETNGQMTEDDLPPQVAAARRMGRPPSARPAPPKLKKQNEPITQDPDVRISSGKRVTNVIVDTSHSDDEDEDDNFIVQDAGTSLVPEPEPMPMRQEEDEVDSGEHGGLVKKILETKKELEGGNQQSGAKKTGIEKPLVSDAARRKEREMVQREIDKLRGSIQTLTRSANPLGKIMDYVQEDLDSMQKELQKWKSENKQHLLALKQEQSITDSSVEPLKAQLKDLDQSVNDQFIQIAAVKAKIMRNDDKINKMLGSITKS